MKKLLSLLLALTTLFTITISFNACDNETSESSQSEPGNEGSVYLLERGDSDYAILLPNNPGESEMIAASEFNEFFFEATDIELPIVYDSQYDSSRSYISIGDTKLFKESEIQIDSDELGSSGYIIKNYKNSLILKGSEEHITYGNIYATYSLLEEIVGYHYVAEDAYGLNKNVRNIQLPKMDVKDVPHINVYSNSLGQLVGDDVEARRLFMEKSLSDKRWATNFTGHSQLEILPYGSGPDSWFYKGKMGYSLNYSNEDMIAEFAERVKYYIENMPEKNGRMFQIGQPDTQDFCDCADCAQLMQEKCMNKCGLQIWFINRVLEIIDPWLTENYPDIDILFTFFVYQYSEAPPVKWDETKQKYVPFSEWVIPHKRLGAYFAPVGLDYSIPINEGSNKGTYENLKGLADLFGHEKIAIWDYCTNFAHYRMNMNNFNSMAENFKCYAEAGVEYVWAQGPGVETFTFSQLRAYLQSKLAWDPYQDMDALAKRFCDIYYGEGGKAIYDYYKLLTNWYTVLELQYGNSMAGTIYFNLSQSKFWPLSLVQQFQACFDEAFKAIEPLKTTNPALYKKYWDRIRRDNLQVDYLMTEFYSGYITDDFVAEYNYYRTYFKCTSDSEGF